MIGSVWVANDYFMEYPSDNVKDLISHTKAITKERDYWKSLSEKAEKVIAYQLKGDKANYNLAFDDFYKSKARKPWNDYSHVL